MVYLLLPNTDTPFLQFLSTVKSHGQHCAEGKWANCFLQAFIAVNLDFWGDKGTGVPVSLVQQSIWTERGHHCPCRRALRYLKYKAVLAPVPTAYLTAWTPNSEFYLKSFLGKFPSQKLFTFSRLPTMFLSLHCYLFSKPQTCMYLKDIFANRPHNALSDWK